MQWPESKFFGVDHAGRPVLRALGNCLLIDRQELPTTYLIACYIAIGECARLGLDPTPFILEAGLEP